MKKQNGFSLALIGLAGALVLGHAQAQENSCEAFAWPLGKEQAWLSAANLTPAEQVRTAPMTAAVTLALKPMTQVAYLMPPEKAPKIAEATGGIVIFDVLTKAGLYQITLSEEAWIDLVQGGVRLPAVAHSGKAGCPGMRKSVRFQLAAQGFALQVSGAAAKTLNFTVTPAE